MQLNKPELVLFDLDGTLVDSIPDLAYSIDAMLGQLGLPLQGEAKVRVWVGRGADRLVKSAVTGDAEGEPDQQLFDHAMTVFSDIYADNTCHRSVLYPGVREGLDHLIGNGTKMGCITNKRARFTDPLLRAMGLYDDFCVVVSGDTLPLKKPDPLQLFHATEQVGVRPEDALMVGDSSNDVQAARAAGMPVIGVRYGYNHGENIEDSRPDRVLDSLAELTELF